MSRASLSVSTALRSAGRRTEGGEDQALMLGEEGGNYWVSFGGRCHLVAPEHLRGATSEEVNDSFSSRVARADLEKLLGLEQDDPDSYIGQDEDIEEDEDLDYVPDFDDDDVLELNDGEGDPGPDPDGDGRRLPRPADRADLPPPPVPKRVRRKGPGDKPHSAMMLKKCLTERSREKQREKELPWHCIPPEMHGDFKQAEDKQIREHYDHSALTPLTLAESNLIRETIPAERILTSRFAYKDKHYARRKLDKTIPWKAKARLVVGGHKDPDAPFLATNAPTISRLAVLSILQVVASRQGGEDPWLASAGDVTSAFLCPALQRLLYLEQPATGVPGMEKGALWKVEKGIFGLVDSPRGWWGEIKDILAEVRVPWKGKTFLLEQLPLDPCVFCLRDVDAPEQSPQGYLGIHVDDLLAAGPKSLCDALKEALSAVLPVDEWLDNEFEYPGSRVVVEADGVTVDQELYTTGRLFTIDIGKDQHDMDPATREQAIDNMSAIGALSWLASQTRPDLQAGVSMAQQLQKTPLVEDLKFTNSLVKKALAHREEGLKLQPVQLDNFEVLAYHDAAWANTRPAQGEASNFHLYPEDEFDGIMEDSPFKNKERKAKRSASKVASQFGVLIVLADRECTLGGEGRTSVLEWRSSSVKRVCRSTFAAETMACSEGLETGQYVRSFFCSLLQGRLKKVEDLHGQHLRCLSDCKSLSEHLLKEGIPKVPSDKRLAIDLAALRQSLNWEKRNGEIPLHWIPTGAQLADILTKPLNPEKWWESMRQTLKLPFYVSLREEEGKTEPV